MKHKTTVEQQPKPIPHPETVALWAIIRQYIRRTDVRRKANYIADERSRPR